MNENITTLTPWRNAASRRVEFYLTVLYPDGMKAYGETLIVTTSDNEAAMRSPVFSLGYDQAQQLFDDMVAQGYKPTNQTDYQPALAATKYHLEDMRKLAFKEGN